MASKVFKATWMGQWRADNSTYVGANNPIRTGGSPGYQSLMGFDKTGILSAINTSKTAARVYLNVYVTAYGSFNLGMHKEASNKATNGIPFYRYAKMHWMWNTGWQRVDITDCALSDNSYSGFKNILNGGYTGPVLYGASGEDQGEAYGVTGNQYHVYLEVTGTWNTAPGIPKITAPTAGISVDKTFELKGNHATDAEQGPTGLRYEWAIDDGTGWKYLGMGAYGTVNKVVDFSTYAETNSARVALRANDGELTGQWAYSPYFTISHNKPPGAPTNLSPQGGALRDRTLAITFSWTHNDADGQSAYDFRWRLQGDPNWTESGKIVSTSKSRVVAANTFPLGTIEWQVRTYDQASLVGPYSASAIFVAAAPSDAPVITDPTQNQSVPTSRINVSWTTATQDEYHLQLVKDGTILWESDVVSTDRVAAVDYDLENNTTYSVRLQTKVTNGLFSAWAETDFTTSFTTPAVPELELFEWQEANAVDIRITNPITGVAGEPNVTSNDLFRKVYGTDEDYIRIATNLSNNGVFRDYFVASGVTYQYYIRAYGDNGTFKDSLGVSIAIIVEDTMISMVSNPDRFVNLQYNPSRSVKRSKDRTLMQFNGRQFPVAEFGFNETWNASLSFAVRDNTTLEVLKDILDSKETLLYRDSRGRREFITVDSIDIDDRFPSGYDVKFSLDKVEYIEEV